MQTMKVKGVIFDLDGVICFTDEFHYRAWEKLANRIGIYFDRNINNRMRGVSRMQSLEILLERSQKKYDQKEKNDFADEKNRYYVDFLKTMDKNDLAEDCINTLLSLKEDGILTAIGSSSKNTPIILKRLGLNDLFDAVADGNCISRSKPDPEVFLKAAEMLGLSPRECIVVEDAIAGIDAGIAGGFITVGTGSAYDYEKSDFRIKKLSDIPNIVKRSES